MVESRKGETDGKDPRTFEENRQRRDPRIPPKKTARVSTREPLKETARARTQEPWKEEAIRWKGGKFKKSGREVEEDKEKEESARSSSLVFL